MPAPRILDPSSIPLKRQSGGNIWATLVPVIQGGIILGLIAVVGLFFVPVLNTEQTYKDEKAKLQREIATAYEDQDQLQLQAQHMRDDPVYVERIARDQLNMGKPGEAVLRFDKYQAPPPAPANASRAASDDGN